MRRIVLCLGFVLAACASQSPPVRTSLTAADAATSLAVGEHLTEEITTIAPGVEGDDPVVNLTLRHADGRSLGFQQGNHTPDDLFVQRPGGALAQVMGLVGEEAPQLYHAASGERGSAEAPFMCGPQGPALIGHYEAPDGTVRIVGLRQPIQVEVRPDGQNEALPYSPDQVCARLSFRKS
jgi:hypothetical protein